MAQSAQIKQIGWWHEEIMSWMIANPEALLRDCAEFFGVTQSWLSTIIHSDVFIDRFAEKREVHFANISRDVASKVNGLVGLTLDVLEERIEKERDNIGLGIVRDTSEMVLKAAGYIGPRPGSNGRGGDVNVFLPGSIDKGTLEESRQLMNQKQPLIEGEVAEIKEKGSLECGDDGTG